MIIDLKNGEAVYGGSTYDYRWQQRVNEWTHEVENGKHSFQKEIDENSGWQNFKIVRVKDFPCWSDEEKRIEEQKMLKMFDMPWNLHRAYVSSDQKRIERQAYHRRYYQKHKEKMKAKRQATRKVKTRCPQPPSSTQTEVGH